MDCFPAFAVPSLSPLTSSKRNVAGVRCFALGNLLTNRCQLFYVKLRLASYCALSISTTNLARLYRRLLLRLKSHTASLGDYNARKILKYSLRSLGIIAMARLKWDTDENYSGDDGTANKRLKGNNKLTACKIHADLNNYGTAASQRSRRVIKRPTDGIVAVPQILSTKSERTRRPAQSIPERGGTSKTSNAMTPDVSEQGCSSRPASQTGLARKAVDPRAHTPEKESLVISLQVQLDHGAIGPPLRQSTGTYTDKGVVTPDQNTALLNCRQNKGSSTPEQATAPWVPRTPGDSPGQNSTHIAQQSFETPSRVAAEDMQKPFTLPTPDSIPRRDSGILQSNLNDHIQSFHNINHTQLAAPVQSPSSPSYPCDASYNTKRSLDVSSPATTLLLTSQPDVGAKTLSQDNYVAENPNDTVISKERLNAIAEQLLAHRISGQTKAEPSCQPQVWADGRQELCETLHYYRAYQGACYSTGGFVRGFMFDNVTHSRDYIDSNVVISRAGGGLAKDKESGEMKAGGDQMEGAVAQGLRNCISHFNPVAIITGIDNPNLPCKAPHQYCVMDYFKPTHIWFEKSGRSKILRYRFERLNIKAKPWWQPRHSRDPVQLGTLPSPVQYTCEICGGQSPQVYLNGWMCLKPDCNAFWNIIATDPRLNPEAVPYEPDEASLIYDPRFLKQRTSWHNDDHEYPLMFDNAKLSGYSIPGEDTSQAFWLGMVCPECGRCNSRLDWMGWRCQNPTCSFQREPPHTLIPASSLQEPLWPLTNSYTLSRDTQSPLVPVQVSFAHGYRINRYNIPGIDGFITHMIANATILEELGGPDAMFEELQQIDIGLRRRPMPSGKLKGPSYCRHFAVNYGMPYKFIAATSSQSFEGAARPITATRSRLNWAAKLLLVQASGRSMEEISAEWKEKEFNEVLALGYFEQQKINYHDDGEHGLGPTIATLSLGAPGSMRVRMKARHYHGVSPAGIYDDAPPLEGCAHYAARASLQPALEALKRSNPKAYNASRRQIPKELGLRAVGQAKDVLNMQLGHGDIVVMHGAALQRYYEHAVEHAGKLRFALTCRYIDPASLKEEDKPSYEVGPDVEGYDGSKLN